MKAFALDGIVGMAAERLTKRAIRDIVETVSGELPATFADDVLKRISAATYVTTFADRVAFTVIVVRLWMAAVLLTGQNLPLLSWSFRAAGVAGASETSLQSMSKPNRAARAFTGRTTLRVFMHYVRILIRLPCDE